MNIKRINHGMSRGGFTLIELIISVVIVMIVALGIGMVIANSSKSYQVEYEKAHSDVMTDSFVARKLFDATIRKAASSDITIAVDGSTAEVKYYNSDLSTYLDRYSRFFLNGSDLEVEHGSIDVSGIKETMDFQTVCGNVTSCVFRGSGNSVRMILALDNNEINNVIVACAYTHN